MKDTAGKKERNKENRRAVRGKERECVDRKRKTERKRMLGHKRKREIERTSGQKEKGRLKENAVKKERNKENRQTVRGKEKECLGRKSKTEKRMLGLTRKRERE